MGNSLKGILAILAASIIWGFSALFYKALAHVPPLEVLAHRTLWSLVFFGIILALRGWLGAVWLALKNRRVVGGLAFAAVMVSLNWGGFITSIQFGYALEASLGYYFFPLMVVLLGALVYGERFSRWQGVALGLMWLAVLVLTFGLGTPPWIALFLATTFSAYAVVKKRIDAGPMVSVFIEVLLLAPLAAVWLYGVHQYGWATVTRWHALALPLIWAALALYSFESWRREASASKPRHGG